MAGRRRPSVAARRSGYVVAILINGAMLIGANWWPGWEVIPFLSDETPQVLGLVNASIIAGLVANAVYVAWDPPRLKALGDLVTTAFGVAAMVQIWRVFPFDFGDAEFNWALLVRWLLGVGIFGGAIGIVVALVALVRGGAQQDAPSEG